MIIFRPHEDHYTFTRQNSSNEHSFHNVFVYGRDISNSCARNLLRLMHRFRENRQFMYATWIIIGKYLHSKQ